jgi:CelD/BcsL family acetyltransferase involved in cellulose biosynthesis
MTRAGSASVRCVTNVRGWEALQSWWDPLLEASPDSTPWQSWDYLWNWWQRFGDDRELRIIVVERASVPVMIFPLQIARERLLGVPTRTVEPLSFTPDVNRPRLTLGAPDSQAFALGFEALWNMRDQWDAIRVDDLQLRDPESQALTALATERGMWFRDTHTTECAPIPLARSWDEFLKTRSSALRETLRAGLRNLAAEGAVQLEVSEAPEDVVSAFNVVLRLQHRGGSDRDIVGFTSSPHYREFFRKFLTSAAAKGRARVLTLWAGDRPVAGAVSILHGDTYFSTEIVHDAALARCSPGTLLESFELERLMGEQRPGAYHFAGRSPDDPRRWTDEARAAHRIHVFQSGLRSWADRHYFRARPAVKRAARAVFGLKRATALVNSLVLRFMPRT